MRKPRQEASLSISVVPCECVYECVCVFLRVCLANIAQLKVRFKMYLDRYHVYDEKSRKLLKVTSYKIAWHFQRFVLFVLFTGALQSLYTLASPWLFPPLGDVTPLDWYDASQLINPYMWKSSLFYAVLFQFYLATFGEGLAFAAMLITRRHCVLIMNNPIFGSRTPSEFWGRRWNTLIHTCLKNGVYKPVRKLGGSKEMAALVSFLASGLLHEQLVVLVFYDSKIPWGTTMLFFIWHAMLICLEYMTSHWSIACSIGTYLPRPMKTALLILCGVPVGQWFMDGYVHSNFFAQSHMALLAVLPIEK